MATEFRQSRLQRRFKERETRNGFYFFGIYKPFPQIWFIKLNLHLIKEGFVKNSVAKYKLRISKAPVSGVAGGSVICKF